MPGPSTASQPRRVLYVEANEDRTTGGSHRALFDLVSRLDRSRFDPVVLFYQYNEYVPRLRNAGTQVELYEAERARELHVRRSGGRLAKVLDALTAIRRRVRFLRGHRIDLLHLNNSPAVGADDWLPAAKYARVPSVASARGVERTHLAGRYLMRRYDRVVAVSDHIAAEMRAAGIPSGRVVRIHDGVDIEGLRSRVRREAAEVRAELYVPAGATLAVMVGNLRAWKGQHVVLEALGAVPLDVRRRLVVAFAGQVGVEDQAYEQRLRALAVEFPESVRFLGGRTDVPDLLHAAEIAVHASIIPEPFGLVVVEAMVFGTPVVAARSGGPFEILAEGGGILYQPGDAPALAGILTGLVCDPDLRRKLGSEAKVAAERFSVARTVESMERLYTGLMA
jgi:glycosyltransferase involved in cell wall biosynthesis